MAKTQYPVKINHMDEKLQTVIFLMRHGHTNYRYFPLKGIDDRRQLDVLGKKQIKLVGKYLNEFAPVAIYASPMHRCQQTAEIIKQACEFKQTIETRQKLAEVYGLGSYMNAGKKAKTLLEEIINKHAGHQVVVVSHQVPIEKTVAALGADKEEADFPCKMGEGYRLVFAENNFVSAQKIRPAQDVV